MSARSLARWAALLDARGPRVLVGCVVAIALWSAFVAVFIGKLSETIPAARRVTLDARLVEIAPPPLPARPAPAATPATTHEAHAHAAPRAAAATRPVTRPGAAAHAPATPLHAPPEPLEPALQPSPVAAPQSATTHATAAETPTAATAAASAASAVAGSTSTTSTTSGDAAAHAILQPLPTLPDDLREYAYQAVALARFTVHADGSVDVALVRPTQNPRLNQLLLETLRKWRFFPAMKAGRPVESEQEIRVHFNVG